MSKKTSTIVASWVFGSLSFAFLVLVFWLAPKPLERAQVRIIAIVSSLLMGFFAFFLTGSLNLFGNTNWPIFGKVTIRAGGGIALFLITLAWWNSEFAPIKTAPLSTEVQRYLEDQASLSVPAASPSEHTIYLLEGATNDSLRGQIAYARIRLINEAFRRGEYDRAIDYCNEALSYEPNFPLARFHRATALFYLKRYDEALTDFTDVVEKVPDFGAAHLGRLLVLSSLHRLKEGMPDAKELTRLGFPEPEKMLNLIVNSHDSSTNH